MKRRIFLLEMQFHYRNRIILNSDLVKKRAAICVDSMEPNHCFDI